VLCSISNIGIYNDLEYGTRPKGDSAAYRITFRTEKGERLS
jgi:hypothetical protein